MVVRPVDRAAAEPRRRGRTRKAGPRERPLVRPRSLAAGRRRREGGKMRTASGGGATHEGKPGQLPTEPPGWAIF